MNPNGGEWGKRHGSTFHSDSIFSKLNPAPLNVAQILNARVPRYFGHELTYKRSAFANSYDSLEMRKGAAQFSIEALSVVPHVVNKYFSTAPLPTEEHIELLQNLESDLPSF